MNKKKINEKYKPFLHCEARYLIIYGGAGSGKSYFTAQKILKRMIEESGHRILVCRKVGTTIKESVFRQILRVMSDFGIRNQFRVQHTKRKITNIFNGNEIICMGLDDPEKLKSITDITSIWVEEATEMDTNDFDQLDLRLRGEMSSYKQIILTFNPTDVNHWIKTRLIDNPNQDDLMVLHSTFHDNSHIDSQYIKVLERQAKDNPNYYRIYSLGEWGNARVKNPFLYNFDYEKHVRPRLDYMYNTPIYFSFDFNIDPFVCVVFQKWRDEMGEHVWFLDEITIYSGDIYQMIERLKSMFNERALSHAFYTGDAMQNKREITQRNNINAWTILMNELRIPLNRLVLPRANPNIKNNRMLCNSLLARHPDYKFHARMIDTISDMQFVECDEDGGIMKDNRRDRHKRADHLDAVRYANNTWLADWEGVVS